MWYKSFEIAVYGQWMYKQDNNKIIWKFESLIYMAINYYSSNYEVDSNERDRKGIVTFIKNPNKNGKIPKNRVFDDIFLQYLLYHAILMPQTLRPV